MLNNAGSEMISASSNWRIPLANWMRRSNRPYSEDSNHAEDARIDCRTAISSHLILKSNSLKQENIETSIVTEYYYLR